MTNPIDAVRIRMGVRPLSVICDTPLTVWRRAELDYYAPGHKAVEFSDLFVYQSAGLVTASAGVRGHFNRAARREIQTCFALYEKDKRFYRESPANNPVFRISPRVIALYGYGDRLYGDFDESFGFTNGAPLPNDGIITSIPSLRFFCAVRDTLDHQPSLDSVLLSAMRLVETLDHPVARGEIDTFQAASDAYRLLHEWLAMPVRPRERMWPIDCLSLNEVKKVLAYASRTDGMSHAIPSQETSIEIDEMQRCEREREREAEARKGCFLLKPRSRRTWYYALEEVSPTLRWSMSQTDACEAARNFEFARRNSICSTAARQLKRETTSRRQAVRE